MSHSSLEKSHLGSSAALKGSVPESHYRLTHNIPINRDRHKKLIYPQNQEIENKLNKIRSKLGFEDEKKLKEEEEKKNIEED